MAYTKQTWATGDKITAEKLNNIEDGVASSLRVCYLQETIETVTDPEDLPEGWDSGEYEVHTLNKTWSELKTMFDNGIIPVSFTSYDNGYGDGFDICRIQQDAFEQI